MGEADQDRSVPEGKCPHQRLQGGRHRQEESQDGTRAIEHTIDDIRTNLIEYYMIALVFMERTTYSSKIQSLNIS